VSEGQRETTAKEESMLRNTCIVAVALFVSVLGSAGAAKPLHPLSYKPYCLYTGEPSYFSALIIGKHTYNEEIEWAADSEFSTIKGVSILEGESGVLVFYANEYPDGVWVRWHSQQDRKTIHIPVPAPC
jgi:hypothetical protein